jgi:DNA-directed RNA polymerase subunit RPC12/RpoP
MNEKCQWKLDEAHGYYDTSCGEAFCFNNEDGPEKNKYRFCPYCGKEIEVKE